MPAGCTSRRSSSSEGTVRSFPVCTHGRGGGGRQPVARQAARCGSNTQRLGAAPAGRAVCPRGRRRDELSAPELPGPLTRDPSKSALHAILRDHLETFLAEHEEAGAPLPRFVTKELRATLSCGVLRNGCAHCRCDGCGFSRVVALSCKGRGSCPRCIGRQRTELARELTERVFPDVRSRHWVLSLPFGLRCALAFDHERTLALTRIAQEKIGRRYRRLAREASLTDPRDPHPHRSPRASAPRRARAGPRAPRRTPASSSAPTRSATAATRSPRVPARVDLGPKPRGTRLLSPSPRNVPPRGTSRRPGGTRSCRLHARARARPRARTRARACTRPQPRPPPLPIPAPALGISPARSPALA